MNVGEGEWKTFGPRVTGTSSGFSRPQPLVEVFPSTGPSLWGARILRLAGVAPAICQKSAEFYQTVKDYYDIAAPWISAAVGAKNLVVDLPRSINLIDKNTSRYGIKGFWVALDEDIRRKEGLKSSRDKLEDSYRWGKEVGAHVPRAQIPQFEEGVQYALNNPLSDPPKGNPAMEQGWKFATEQLSQSGVGKRHVQHSLQGVKGAEFEPSPWEIGVDFVTRPRTGLMAMGNVQKIVKGGADLVGASGVIATIGLPAYALTALVAAIPSIQLVALGLGAVSLLVLLRRVAKSIQWLRNTLRSKAAKAGIERFMSRDGARTIANLDDDFAVAYLKAVETDGPLSKPYPGVLRVGDRDWLINSQRSHKNDDYFKKSLREELENRGLLVNEGHGGDGGSASGSAGKDQDHSHDEQPESEGGSVSGDGDRQAGVGPGPPESASAWDGIDDPSSGFDVGGEEVVGGASGGMGDVSADIPSPDGSDPGSGGSPRGSGPGGGLGPGMTPTGGGGAGKPAVHVNMSSKSLNEVKHQVNSLKESLL